MLARLFPDRFVPVLFATILLASLLPVRGGAVPIAQGVSTAAIVFLFFLNGVRLPRDEAPPPFVSGPWRRAGWPRGA